MNIIKSINFVTFKDYNKTYYNGENKVVESYNDNNKLTNRVTYDKFDRVVLANWFDEWGNDNGFMQKEYVTDGFIETCKTPTQEYKRICRNFIKDGFQYYTEKYLSKNRPENNYYNESIRNMFGKLVKMISNGKIIFEQKL